MNTNEYWALTSGETLNDDIAALPKAEIVNIAPLTKKGEPRKGIDAENFRAVIVNNEVVNCPTKTYTLVQHETAFRPVIEGITQAGLKDFRYSLYNDERQAHLNIYVDTAEEKGIKQGINVGFRISNSFDRSTSIRYGFQTFSKTKTFELVGYRQVCGNGMIVQVPLEEASITRVEEKNRLKELLSLRRRITHVGNVETKLFEVQHIAEALAILIKPFERMVEAAKKIKYEDLEVAKKLVEKHVSKRMKDRLIARYINDQDNSLWGLYNAITYEASHGELVDSTRMGLLRRSGELLTQQLLVKAEQ